MQRERERERERAKGWIYDKRQLGPQKKKKTRTRGTGLDCKNEPHNAQKK